MRVLAVSWLCLVSCIMLPTKKSDDDVANSKMQVYKLPAGSTHAQSSTY